MTNTINKKENNLGVGVKESSPLKGNEYTRKSTNTIDDRVVMVYLAKKPDVARNKYMMAICVDPHHPQPFNNLNDDHIVVFGSSMSVANKKMEDSYWAWKKDCKDPSRLNKYSLIKTAYETADGVNIPCYSCVNPEVRKHRFAAAIPV